MNKTIGLNCFTFCSFLNCTIKLLHIFIQPKIKMASPDQQTHDDELHDEGEIVETEEGNEVSGGEGDEELNKSAEDGGGEVIGDEDAEAEVSGQSEALHEEVSEESGQIAAENGEYQEVTGHEADEEGEIADESEEKDHEDEDKNAEEADKAAAVNEGDKLLEESEELEGDVEDKGLLDEEEEVAEQGDVTTSSNRRKRRILIDSDDEDAGIEEEETKAVEGEDAEPQLEEELSEHADEDTQLKEEGDVTELMQNIFGDDMSDDDEDKGAEGTSKRALGSDDEDEPKLLRVEQDEDEEEDVHGHRWDFDVMLAKKKHERRRRRRKDGSIDLMADADDQIKALVDAMNEAATEDRHANNDRRPAIKKRKMLPIVKNTLMKADLFEAMLDNGMITAISEWLAPLPDKSLPALEIRCTLLKIMDRWPNLEQGILKQSGLGRAIMYLYKHPKETRENKIIAAKLIREWSRPIFQLDSDFRSLSKEERVQRDYSQMPLAKRKRLSVDDESGIPIFSAGNSKSKKQVELGEQAAKRPGDPGFIPRARVPKPSTKDYVVRPRPDVEGQFRGATKGKQATRFVKTQREFQKTNKTGLTKRAMEVSLAGKNI